MCLQWIKHLMLSSALAGKKHAVQFFQCGKAWYVLELPKSCIGQCYCTSSPSQSSVVATHFGVEGAALVTRRLVGERGVGAVVKHLGGMGRSDSEAVGWQG